MLLDMRLKIRNRFSRLSSSDLGEFFALSKQFFEFIKKHPVVDSSVQELLARNTAIAELEKTQKAGNIYGDTDQEAAALGFIVWHKYAAQSNPHFLIEQSGLRNGLNESLNKYREKFLYPLFDYLDEVLEDANVVLATLRRYKHKVEWYRREELQNLFEANSQQGEKVLAKHMYEYLFDQGIPFHVEPQTASGRPDVVALEDSDHPFIGDVKVFDAAGRGATYLKKGLYQVHLYCCDKNESVGHLIVFNVSNKQLRLDLPSSGDMPRFEYGQKTIFITVIDIHAHEGSASTRGIPETVTISAEELIREMKEQEQSEAINAAE